MNLQITMQQNKLADVQNINIKKLINMQNTINELTGIVKQYKQKTNLQATQSRLLNHHVS